MDGARSPARDLPANLTGVPVVLTAIDSNGNVVDIGATTTNGYYGTFAKEWTPPNAGTYQIVANSEGDESYGSSAASTALTIGAAPEISPTPTQSAAPTNLPYEWYTIGTGIAIIIAMAVAVLLLRKRP